MYLWDYHYISVKKKTQQHKVENAIAICYDSILDTLQGKIHYSAKPIEAIGI